MKAEQKISDTAGGLTATLDDSDTFGVSVAGVGDLDGDGRIDLAVGAHQDDDGGTNRGAVYVLFLNADGTVKGEQKISDTAGGLTATLDDSDTFGVSVAGVGDLDGDGRIDLAVGAFRDDDGGTDRGAIHVLQMGPPMPAVNSTGDASDANPGDDVCDTGGTVGGDPECTLRAAIEEANASPSIDTIHFAIPASDSGHSGGVWTINPTTGLPTITDGVIVDGTTQSGWTASTTAAPAGLDGTQVVVIDGAGTVADGLRLAGDDITVRGLVIGGFDGDGVVVTGARAIVQAAYVGTGAAGSVANPNTGNGMTVAGVDAVIGSSGPADRMLVSGNGGQGIEILATASNAAVLGSIVGLDAAATAALANGANGLRLSGSTGTTVGAPGAGNVIAGNNLAPATADGIYVSGGSGHTIRANLIGTNLADAPLGNFNAGVAVSSATGVTIGGSLAGDGNTIARNGGDGITITGAGSTVSVLGNSMSNNGDLGIDLAGDGVTANDAGDGDSGPNGLLNSPVLVAADVSGSVVVVDYSLDAPAGTYRLEFHGNPAGGDPSGFGEGGTLLGTASLVHGGSGPQSGTVIFAAAVGTVLSATTTEDLGGGFYGSTSEFSAVIVASAALLPSVEDLSIRRSDLRADGGLDPGSAEVAGLAGRAMALDGVAERLQGPALDIASGELTMEALIRLDSLSGAPRVVSKSNAASTPIYELFVDGGTGEAVASIRVGGAAATARGGVVSTATWHHLSATWDGTELILFVDGAEVDRVPAVGALAVDVTTDVVIGADGAAAPAAARSGRRCSGLPSGHHRPGGCGSPPQRRWLGRSGLGRGGADVSRRRLDGQRCQEPVRWVLPAGPRDIRPRCRGLGGGDRDRRTGGGLRVLVVGRDRHRGRPELGNQDRFGANRSVRGRPHVPVGVGAPPPKRRFRDRRRRRGGHTVGRHLGEGRNPHRPTRRQQGVGRRRGGDRLDRPGCRPGLRIDGVAGRQPPERPGVVHRRRQGPEADHPRTGRRPRSPRPELTGRRTGDQIGSGQAFGLEAEYCLPVAPNDESPPLAPDLESFLRCAVEAGQGRSDGYVDTCELRWFASGPLPPEVEDWFTGADFVGTREHRRDLYQLTGLSDVGVKRRSGRTVEAKIRMAVGPRMAIGDGLEATFDRWRKWRPSQGDAIWPTRQARWVPVDKTVLTRTFADTASGHAGNGGTSTDSGHGGDDVAAAMVAGCDVELAAITIGGLEAWTFGLEAFGPQAQRGRAAITAWEQVVAEVGRPRDLGSRFDLADGYPAWLQLVTTQGVWAGDTTRHPRHPQVRSRRV